MASAIKNALLPDKKNKTSEGADRKAVVKTLIDSFRYPRKGPGMLWEECAQGEGQGNQVIMGARADKLDWSSDRGTWKVGYVRPDGTHEEIEGREVISSAPLREVVHALTRRCLRRPSRRSMRSATATSSPSR